jgi:6-phosphofructokinase 2
LIIHNFITLIFKIMPAIITITFNPALDKSTSVAELVPDKKLKCTSLVCEPGGGGINVARAIKELGGEATAVYLAGGCIGKKITEMLSAEFVETIVIDIREDTRENLVVADITNDKQYLFDMPGPKINEFEWRACLNTIEHIPGVEYIIASGSLPPGVPTDIFAKLALIARKKNARLIVDTSGEALKQAVLEGVYLIKPNLRELASLAGKDELGIESVVGVARGLIGRGNCEVVVVSMGALGATLVTKDLAVNIKPPPQHIRSTVGAGDSMVAGIALSLAENKSLTQAVQYGVACGTAATMSPGTELCRKKNAEHLYRIIQKEILVPD